MIAARQHPLDAEAHERHRPPRPAIASGPSRCTSSAGSLPAGSGTTRSSSLPRAASAGGPQHRVLTGPVGVERQQHSRREAGELRDLLPVSAVPIRPTVLRTPAWCIAITSV